MTSMGVESIIAWKLPSTASHGVNVGCAKAFDNLIIFCSASAKYERNPSSTSEGNFLYSQIYSLRSMALAFFLPSIPIAHGSVAREL